MRNSNFLLAGLLGAVFILVAAGGALAQDNQGENMKTEQDQATQQMLMIDSGKMGHGMMTMLGGGIPKLMSVDHVKAMLSHWLSRHIGDRVKVGAVEELGVFAFGVDVTTVDGSLVLRLAVDRRDHGIWRID